MKKLPIPMLTINAATGKTTSVGIADFKIMPPPAAACQICGKHPAHHKNAPHDAQSIYFQYAFFSEHARWPTWKDAVAHCPPEVRKVWEKELRLRGAWTEPQEDEE